jgi:hypothetical protein
VVEDDRYAAGREEDGHAIADDQGPRVVNLKSPASVDFYREYAKRLSLSEFLKNVSKVVGCHN